MRGVESTKNCSRYYRASWSTLLFTAGFGASLTVARELLDSGAVSPGIFSWLVAVAPIALGLFALLSYVRFIAAMDELWIRIYLHSLSFAFGVSVLGLLTYPMLEFANAPPLDPLIYGGFCIVVFGGALFHNARKFG